MYLNASNYPIKDLMNFPPTLTAKSESRYEWTQKNSSWFFSMLFLFTFKVHFQIAQFYFIFLHSYRMMFDFYVHIFIFNLQNWFFLKNSTLRDIEKNMFLINLLFMFENIIDWRVWDGIIGGLILQNQL
jgi:hypothetical protein